MSGAIAKDPFILAGLIGKHVSVLRDSSLNTSYKEFAIVE
jgi:hypothetical protein